jgi:hypothetical protein
MCELNPMELEYTKSEEDYLRSYHNSRLFAVKIEEMTKDAIVEVNTNDWKGFCNHIKIVWKNTGLKRHYT